MSEVKTWRDKPITDRQRAGIRLVLEQLYISADIPLLNRGDASDFLDQHLPAAKRALRESMSEGWAALDDENQWNQ